MNIRTTWNAASCATPNATSSSSPISVISEGKEAEVAGVAVDELLVIVPTSIVSVESRFRCCCDDDGGPFC